MKKLAIIPARGGSKRIPRKNIKFFLGKPIIAYAIEVAQDSGLFDEIMVSTEDSEIAEVAQFYGATVPFKRNDETANDFATTKDVIYEVIENYKRHGHVFDDVCCIYPTAPLTTKEHLQLGYSCLKENKFASVVPVIRYSYPIWRAFKTDNHSLKMIFPENVDKRSQDIEDAFHDAGQWYWLSSECIKGSLQIFNENTGAIVLSEMEAQDIDNMDDWRLAEMKYTLIKKNEK